jgi:UDP-N-acetylmuramate dehydrogenase
LVIFSVSLRLEEGVDENIAEKMNYYLDYRDKKHPKEPSAGSCFKNISIENLPEGFFEKFPETKAVVKDGILPTAFLIHSCGLKGEKIGSIEISTIHPNFLINTKDGSADDVLKLIDLVKKKIKEKYGLEIEEEVKILDKLS